jgi:hypothetical protein
MVAGRAVAMNGLDVFVNAILRHARESGEPLISGHNRLRQIARLDALYLMLEWTGRPAVQDTRYMVIEGGDASQRRLEREDGVPNIWEQASTVLSTTAPPSRQIRTLGTD